VTERSTAYHEAGHVVAAVAQGVALRAITIVPDKQEGYAGRVQHGDLTSRVNLEADNTARTRSRIERQIVIALAGAAAQRRYDRRSWRSFHSSSDYEVAANLADAISSSPAASEAFLKWLAAATDDLITARWAEVEKIAKALLCRARASGSFSCRERSPRGLPLKRWPRTEAERGEQSVTKLSRTTIEEITNTMSAAVLRAMKGLREVSNAIAELREAELMLNGLSPSESSRSAKSTVPLRDPPGTSQSQTIEDRRSSDRDHPWRVNELAATLKVNRRTIERRIKDGTLKVSKVVGITLIDAKSVKTMCVPKEGRGRGE
jgi:hypothetical protein